MAKNYYTTREAAKLLGTCLRTAQQWVETGRLKGWKTEGGHRRIDRNSVHQMLKTRSPCGPPGPKDALPILIIEDDANLLKLYRLQIARWPEEISIYSAPNGYEGLVMVGEVSPCLLICDIRLPGINGFQVVRSLCEMERHKNMAIIVVSGLPPEEIEAHGGLPERVEQMGKPIDFPCLREIALRHCAALSAKQPKKRVRQNRSRLLAAGEE
jgi:excisionase family DNA binding protein